ncbi:MAG: hypothetical protein FWH04_01935 [Oscillospiraceae bacterium]|nr:hypothetical protein [Oscillospiraceae bacterium]
MINPTTQANLEKAFKDEAFAKKVLAMQDLGDVQAELKTKGVDMSIEEIKEIGEATKKIVERQKANPDAELSIDDLEDVAGGAIITTCIFLAAAAAALIGGGAAAAVFMW